MAEETVKKVKVDYTVEDHAAGPLGRIAQNAEHAAKTTERLKERFKEFRGEALLAGAGILGVGFGLGSLIEKAKEANVEFGGVQKSIASTMATILDWPKTMAPIEKFQRSMVLSKIATGELEDAAARFGMGLQDVAGAYKTVGIAAGPLHISQEKWIDLATKSAAAAKQFGISGEEAANTIGKALVSKSIRASSDFGKYLVNEVGGNLHKLNNAQILARLDKALTQSAGIAEQMGMGVSGSIARIQIRVGEMFREVTGPLFREVASTLDGFGKKLKDGSEAGKSLREVFADKLVAVFRDLKEATAFLADHWKQIAVVVAGMKINGLMRDMGGLAANMMRAIGSIGQGISAGGITGFTSALGPAIAGLAALKIGLDALTDYIDKKMDEGRAGQLRAAGSTGSMQNLVSLAAHGEGPMTEFQRKVAKQSMDQLTKAGIIGASGRVDKEKFGNEYALMDIDRRKRLAESMGVPVHANIDHAAAMADSLASIAQRFFERIPPNAGESDVNRKTTGKPQILFTGENKFEFKWEDVDPEKAMLRFKDDMENYVGRRTQAAGADPFGD